MYEYRCHTLRVIDGNTIDAQIDLGFGVFVKQRIKLFGVNAGNIKNPIHSEQEAAIAARNKLLELIGNQFVCKTIMNKRGKTGRILGKVYVETVEGLIDVNQTMIDLGFASPFGD